MASVLNAARKRLQQLLKLVCDDRVAEIAIPYPDRLTRFGTEYLETLFTSFGVTFALLDPTEDNTPDQELGDRLALLARLAPRALAAEPQTAVIAWCARWAGCRWGRR